MGGLLHSVQNVFNANNGGLLSRGRQQHYFIPLYQRGYKWSKKQVDKLLDDIDGFQPAGSKFYCLQNITLVEDSKEPRYNVVDGQQRLTTLVLLLSYLGEHDLVRDKVRFPNHNLRKHTNNFINNVVMEQPETIVGEDMPANTIEAWKHFIDTNKEYDHQDIFFLFQAYRTIHEWFNKEDNDKRKSFPDKLKHHVKLIINNIENGREERIFTNLNSKRVPLDGADLVRAILITRVAREEGAKEADVKNVVRVSERRVKIGSRLDAINHWWSGAEVKTYFSQWTKTTTDGDIKFDEQRYPINTLYYLFMETVEKNSLNPEYFEQHDNELELFKKLVEVHETLVDWFTDKELYHLLGFLFAQFKKELTFGIAWQWWQQDGFTRQHFKNKLVALIKEKLLPEGDDKFSINKHQDWYNDDQQRLIQVLIFLDVIQVLQPNNDLKRLPAKAFDRKKDDIEHIFPQTPQQPNHKERKDYLIFLKDVIGDERGEIAYRLEKYDEMQDDEEFIREVDEQIRLYTNGIKINSIGNLVLLKGDINKGLGNHYYYIKRRRIMQKLNEGVVYIRPHTLRVFAKYFLNEHANRADHDRWTNADIELNEGDISNQIENFFKNGVTDAR